MSQLSLFSCRQQPANRRAQPYQTFDASAAKACILKRLQQDSGEWIRRRALIKATGMRPAMVCGVLTELCRTGLIEHTETLPLIHPMHGHMGQTTGYRTSQQREVAA